MRACILRVRVIELQVASRLKFSDHFVSVFIKSRTAPTKNQNHENMGF